jgi:hypothetical protein
MIMEDGVKRITFESMMEFTFTDQRYMDRLVQVMKSDACWEGCMVMMGEGWWDVSFGGSVAVVAAVVGVGEEEPRMADVRHNSLAIPWIQYMWSELAHKTKLERETNESKWAKKGWSPNLFQTPPMAVNEVGGRRLNTIDFFRNSTIFNSKFL